jgi:hypothetical protein
VSNRCPFDFIGRIVNTTGAHRSVLEDRVAVARYHATPLTKFGGEFASGYRRFGGGEPRFEIIKFKSH